MNSQWLFSLQHSSIFIPPENFFLNSNFLFNDFFYEYSFHIYNDHKHWGYCDLKKNLIPKYKFLKSVTDSQFKNKCQHAFNKIKSMDKLDEENSSYDIKQLNENKIHSAFINSKKFKYKMKKVQTSELKIEGQWTETETENLLIVLKQGYITDSIFNSKGQIHWPSVAKFISFRTGESCRNKYNNLKKAKDERIDHIFEGEKDNKIWSYQSNDHFYKSLTDEDENYLLQKIINLIESNQLVTVKMIQEFALKIFNSPLNIASKAFVVSKFKKKENPLNENGQINIEKYEDEFQKFLEIANTEPQKLIDDFLCDFTASKSWVCNFMMKKNLVFKKAHFQRRGQISDDQVERYLNEVAIAIDEYGEENVVNMDETSVKTENFPTKLISEKGKDDVYVEKDKLNEKEATTFLGAICFDPSKRIPLGIISKGKTKVSEKKFGLTKKSPEFIGHTKSGWTSSDVIVRYLRWLKKQMKSDKFALIIDVYKSHIDQKVKTEAKKLGIQLIYVPASGTSLYQPLDIKIYGITKNKLIQKEKDDPVLMGKNRFKQVTKNMTSIFNNLSDHSIRSAWNIPSLNKLLVPESKEDKSDYEWLPDDDK